MIRRVLRLIVVAALLPGSAAAARVEIAVPHLVAPRIVWSGGGAIGVGGFQGRDPERFEAAVVAALGDPQRGLPKGQGLPSDDGGNSSAADVPVFGPQRVEAALAGLPADHPTVHARLRPLLGAGLWVSARLEAPDWDDRAEEHEGGGPTGRGQSCVDRAVELRAEVTVQRLDAGGQRVVEWVRARAHSRACGANLNEAEARIDPVEVLAEALLTDLGAQVAGLVAPTWSLTRFSIDRTAQCREGLDHWAKGRRRDAAAFFMLHAEGAGPDAGAQAHAAVFLAAVGHLDEAQTRIRLAMRLSRDERWARIGAQIDTIALHRERLRQMGLILEPLALQPSASR